HAYLSQVHFLRTNLMPTLSFNNNTLHIHHRSIIIHLHKDIILHHSCIINHSQVATMCLPSANLLSFGWTRTWVKISQSNGLVWKANFVNWVMILENSILLFYQKTLKHLLLSFKHPVQWKIHPVTAKIKRRYPKSIANLFPSFTFNAPKDSII